MSFLQRIAHRRDAPLVVLALFVLGLAVLIARIGVENHNVFIDEVNAILFGREIQADPSSAFSGAIARGPERMMSLLTAAAAAVTGSATKQLWGLHVVTALGQALVAVPVWATARRLGLGRWAALVPATIGAAGGFAMYGVTLLNTPLGMLAAMCLVWAMVRSLDRPGVASDGLVLVTLALLVLTRIGWAPLVGALIPAALAATWVARPLDEPVRRTLRELPRRLLRRHPVLLPAALVLLVGVLLFGSDRFVGGQQYGGVRLSPDLELGVLWDNSRLLFAHLSVGVAIVPMILALPVLLRDLVRPADPVAAGFAWLVVGLVAVFSYVYYFSMNEDRYFAVLAPPIVLAAATAVFRRPPPLWSIVVSGLVVARAVVTAYARPGDDPFDFFIAPTSRFFGRVVVGNLSVHAPVGGTQAATLAVLAAVVAAGVVGYIMRRHLRGRLALGVAAAVFAALLVVQVAGLLYPAQKWVDLVGQPTVSSDAFGYIDRAAGSGPVVRPMAVDGAIDPDLAAQLPGLQVFNTKLGTGFAVFRGTPATPPGPSASSATVDPRTGTVQTGGDVPRIVMEKPGFHAVGFAGTPIQVPPQFGFGQLERLDQPLRVRWVIPGTVDVAGYPPAGEPLRMTVFPLDGHAACVAGGVAAHPLGPPAAYRLKTPGGPLKGTAAPGQPTRFTTKVPAGPPATLRLTGSTTTLPDGSKVGPTIVDVTVSDC